MKNCFVCKRIQDIKNKKSPYFVRELETGYVVMCDFQLFRGYTIFLSKIHAKELHNLNSDFKQKFLNEMSLVAEAVIKTFHPIKLNYELLGNTDEHVHWHLIPRYGDDEDPGMPIWVLGRKILADEKNRPTKKELEQMKKKLQKELLSVV